MKITCGCGHEYQSKIAPPPEGEKGDTLVVRYAEDAHVCPECQTDNTPDLSKGVWETIGMGTMNIKGILALELEK
jgi:hypothetical protein